jgi:hypothetical protein
MARHKATTHGELARRLGVARSTAARWSAGDVPEGFPVVLRKLPSGRLALTVQDWQRLAIWAALPRRGKRVPDDVTELDGLVGAGGETVTADSVGAMPWVAVPAPVRAPDPVRRRALALALMQLVLQELRDRSEPGVKWAAMVQRNGGDEAAAWDALRGIAAGLGLVPRGQA